MTAQKVRSLVTRVDENEPKSAEAERPAFARSFPRDPQLDALVAAFDAGNFARVRVEAPRLVASSERDEVKKAAAALLARTKPDPLAALLVGLAAVILIALSAWWVVENGGHR